MGRAALDAAIAAAVPEALAELAGTPPGETETTETTVAPVVTERTVEVGEPKPATPDPGKAEPKTVEVEDDEDEDTSVPESLFGVDITRLEEADRKEFIKEWTEQNKTIQKLQREKAEQAAAPPPPVAVEPEQPAVADLSDEDIAGALGIDLENTLDPAAAKAAIALARGFAELRNEVAELGTSTEAAETQRTWTAELDRLEVSYGKLPGERADVLAMAKAEGIENPELAYWRVAGPIRFQVAEALDKRLGTARKTAKKAATSPRPKTSAPVNPAKLEAKTAKEAVAEAAKQAIAELGIVLTD
jgi:hypothetical protein